ncbi:hypothetical protein ABVK25_000900 [Lepraria finkii]|uniref:Uncharacterized protein n=1 Tax=Lepraria finkii TaxID=1340010 RepID=A0ABR4BP71_9LECA
MALWLHDILCHPRSCTSFHDLGPFVLFPDNLAQRMNKLGCQEDLCLGEYSPVSRNRSSTPSTQQEMAISHYPFPGRRQISYGFALVPCEVKLAGTTFDVQRQWSLQVSDASSIKCFEMWDFGPFAVASVPQTCQAGKPELSPFGLADADSAAYRRHV